MNLLRETRDFSAWFVQAMQTFLSARPHTTLAVVLLSAVGSMAKLLSLLLPLKVILLADSEGTSKHFAFIDPANEALWIGGLSLLAVGSYLLFLFSESLVSRLSADAGRDILARANALSILNNQEQKAQKYYTDCCRICSNLLFITAAFFAMLLFNPLLCVSLAALSGLEFAMTAWILRGQDLKPGAAKRYIQEKSSDYLKILSTLIFLSAFLIILVPLLGGRGTGILAAVMGIILVRRLLSFMVDTVKTAVSLHRSRSLIASLVFPEVQHQIQESSENQALRKLFSKKARQSRTEKELAQAMPLPGQVEVLWADSAVKGVSIFTIIVNNNQENPAGYYQQQVFPSKNRHLLENEDFLFHYISRSSLRAPRLITRFREARFECQICDYGLGLPPGREKWEAAMPELLGFYWSLQPPAELIRAYRTTHRLLHERLEPKLANRLKTGADTRQEKRIFKELMQRLPRIREKLAAIPLYVQNPELIRENTVLDSQGSMLVMTWGRWRLEPAGFSIPRSLEQNSLAAMVEQLRLSRDDVPADLDADHLSLACSMRLLEADIWKSAYKSGLQRAACILQNLDSGEYRVL